MNEQNLKDFALELLAEDGQDWDGFDLEDLAEKHGLIIRVTRRAPCMEDGCVCAQIHSPEEFERGDVQCYDKADYLFTKTADWPREKDQRLLHFAVASLMYLSGEDDLDGHDIAAIAFDHELMTENGLVDWIGKPTEYTRPELTAEDRKQAEQYAGMVFRKYGIAKVTVMIASLCLENIRLLKEVNEHRAARGIDPLPTFEV